MKPIPMKIRRLLDAAGLWGSPCLRCGALSGIQAEHAAYDTPDCSQGMGAARKQEDWAIIPLCADCHADSHGAKKRLNLLLAFRVCDYVYVAEKLSFDAAAHFRRLADEFPESEYAVVFGRTREWARWLQAAKRGERR